MLPVILVGMEGFGSPPFIEGPALLPPPLLPAPGGAGPELDPPAPLVKVRVRAPACTGPMAELKYCILVENCSPAEAHHVVVKNPLPKNAKFVKAEPEPTEKDGELRWNIGTLGGGACREIVLYLRPTDREDVKNCVRVQYEHGQCVTTRQFAGFGPGAGPQIIDGHDKDKDKDKDGGKEKDKDKKEKTKDKDVPPPPDKDKPAKLKLTIDGPAKQYLNLSARYFITVTNEGIGPAGNLLVTFDLAKNAEFLKAGDEGKHIEGQVAWVLGTLNVGQTRTVVVELKAKAVGELCHKARALADGGIATAAEKCTIFAGVSALLLEMYDRDDPLDVGGDTSYPVLVRNTGSAPVTNLQLKAVIGDNLALARAKGPMDHRLGEKTPRGQELLFNPVPTLEPGAEINFEVFVKGARPGDARFRVEMSADQLREGGPVVEEETTQVIDEEARGLMRRRVSRPEPYRPAAASK